jgi:hypothetical protein
MMRLKALSDEIDAASSLFHYGFRILQDYKFATRDADPLFVCLAGGSEKLLKLTIGLHEMEDTDSWPSATVMQGFGHKITALDNQVRPLIRNACAQSTAPGYVQQLLDQVACDPYIEQILATLERYAVHGRFHNLDYLGDKPQPEASPAELWEELHQGLLELRPDLLAKLGSSEWEEGRQEINKIIGKSIRLWCELIARSWMTGVIGEQARQWSFQLGLHES